MKAAGCKSDESKQFLSVKFGNLRLVHQFRIGGCTWLHSRNASTLIEAIEKEAGVDVKGR
jgi:hypothetical protein